MKTLIDVVYDTWNILRAPLVPSTWQPQGSSQGRS
jgi:hypothetical protein